MNPEKPKEKEKSLNVKLDISILKRLKRYCLDNDLQIGKGVSIILEKALQDFKY